MSTTKSSFQIFSPKTIDYVIKHWEWRKKRGKKNPSACLLGHKNPKKSLRIALMLSTPGQEVQTYDLEDLAHGEEWPRKCSLCFYRDGSSNPTRDCQILVKKNDHPKTLFGFSLGQRLPETIDGKELGNYCPNFLPFTAE